MTAPPNELIFVSGQRGSGKSTWVKRFAYSLPRVVILDTLGEYSSDSRFYEVKGLVDFFIEDQSNPRLFRVSYDTHTPGLDFDLFCRSILARGNMYVIIEELDILATPFNCPVELAKIIKYGRHYNIQVVGVSRRPAEVSRLFTSQCSRYVIFQQREPSDIKYWRSVIGSVADEIPNLPKYHFLDVDYSDVPSIERKSPIQI